MRVLVVYCHPDPGSFVSAARDRVIRGLRQAGHEVRLDDLYADGFEPVMGADERSRHAEPGVHPLLDTYADHLRWCERLVVVYPTWWSGQPAMLKGWFDRVWARGVAWHLPAGSAVLRPMLGNIRAIAAVTTHGSGKLVNAVEGEAGKRVITRAARAMCHPRCRTHWWAFYGADTASHAERARYLDRLEHRAARW